MSDVSFPRALTLPTVDTGTAGKTGSIGMSGASLMIYDGTGWKTVTAS